VTITQLPVWDATAIEIALDLAVPRYAQPGLDFSGPGEPRVCLVAGFALSSQLPRIVNAVDRTIPARLPSPLRISPAPARSSSSPSGVSVQPVLPLLRLQSRLIRSIEPGLINDHRQVSVGGNRHMDDATLRFIRDFIASKMLPSFEPVNAATAFADMLRLRVVGITIYQLGRRGAPQSIVEHWTYKTNAGSSVHLVRGP